MGIETILFVGLVILVLAIVGGVNRAKRRARERNLATPPSPDARP